MVRDFLCWKNVKKYDLITLAKFLVEDGRYRYIFSGSLLGVKLNNIVSWPVGYMRELRMFPLDFEEFLWAMGLKQNVFEYLTECFNEKKPIYSFIHTRLMDAFYKYLLIGGCLSRFKLLSNEKDINYGAIFENFVIIFIALLRIGNICFSIILFS